MPPVETVRFFSPRRPDLFLASVPVQFVDGVADLDDPDKITRLKYLGKPHGVTWANTSPDGSALLNEIRNPASPVGALLRELFEEKISREMAIPGQIVVLQEDGALALDGDSAELTPAVREAVEAAKDRKNHTGTQPASTIEGLAQVATTGSYDSLLNRPE